MDKVTKERLTTRHSGVAVIKDKSKIKEAMQRLALYEETGLTPEEVIRVNDFVKSGTASLLAKIARLEQEREWIPTDKVTPFNYTTVLATVKHRRWISDLGTEDEVVHPERLEVCTVHIDEDVYTKLDDSDYQNVTYIPLEEQEENIEDPIEEVIAWQPLPEAYKEGE